jgi:hypothetical protein
MKIRNLSLVSLSPLATLFGFACVMGCGGPTEATSTDETLAALTACHLNDGTVEHDALIRACDPQDKKKTTICHVPPGNPANAHTLCIGNAAVPAHLGHHHGDHVGACEVETRCPPPAGDASTGGTTGGDHGSTGGSTGTGTGGQTPPPPSNPGTGGANVIIVG